MINYKVPLEACGLHRRALTPDPRRVEHSVPARGHAARNLIQDFENIQAGVEILSKEGIGGLSLRKVAKRAGVSHSAPYAHFSDKQPLIAAISTEGFNQLYAELETAVSPHANDPKRQVIEATRAYTHFALNHADTLKIMFSDALEKEKEYPAFLEISQKPFDRVVDIVRACQAAAILGPGSPDMIAVSVWGQVHGIISLALEGQITHIILDQHSVQDLVMFAVEQSTLFNA